MGHGPLRQQWQSRLFMPSWWVRSYEAALLQEARLAGGGLCPSLGTANHQSAPPGVGARRSDIAPLPVAPSLFFPGRVLPTATPYEVHVLALVIAHVQRQLFTEPGLFARQRITVDLLQLSKELGAQALNRKAWLDHLLMSLGSLRLLWPQGEGNFTALPLFCGEYWACAGDKRELTLDLAPLGQELFSGFTHGYKDLCRKIAGAPTSSELLAGQGPLLIWRSLWLDLQGVEQAVLLRLEKAMQWTYRCLQLEGVFGESLEVIFAHLRKGGGRSGSEGFNARLRTLQKLARKLHEHGFLSQYAGDDYLAFTGDEKGLQFVWKVAPHHFLGEEYTGFRHAVADAYEAQSRHDDELKGELLRCLGADSKLAAALCQLAGNLAGGRPPPALIIDGHVLLPPFLLFLEWSLRRQRGPSPGEVLALPASVMALPLFALLAQSEDSQERLAEKFEQFVTLLASSEGLCQLLTAEAGATLCSQATQNLVTCRSWLQAQRLSLKEAPKRELSAVASAAKAPLAASPDHPAGPWEAAAKGGLKQTGMRDGFSRASSTSPNGEAISPLPIAEPLPPMIAASFRRRAVVEKLEKIKKSSPARYDELSKAYLQSLDEASRRLILDIKQRMQPPIFEKHLQQRLIQFMLEHPDVAPNDDVRGDKGGMYS